MRASVLLTVDAAINLALGVFLVFFPASFVSAVGIPGSESAFYPSILGAVLFGIGIALLLERFRGPGGLGLMGAVSINLSGGVVLAAWLLSGSLVLPLRGSVTLWALVLILVGISGFELFAQASRRLARSANR
jgi:hypothetical protein